ncbi:hypothetical protein Patl1_27393 [Pistacia atlantica]|uniref:Uncharacterized protein n=1 Tax=Pistacia atlantica TaxID=434234 RepID=A0ACC1BEQ9_9ROSI|nr:hypothetical protein Patl1_27393 [Pistacia atlantica]
MKKRIAIIGAGISSLLAYSKATDSKIFSNFPWPSSVNPNQHHALDFIQSYSHHFDFLMHIKFNTKVVGIEYGVSDEELRSWRLWNGDGTPFTSQGKWKIVAEDILNHSTEVYQVDFVILCVGKLGDVPNIPKFPPNNEPEAFHGKVIPSMEYAALDYESVAEFVKGKRSTVFGFQKSALDIGMECTGANEKFYAKVDEGSIILKKSPSFNFCEEVILVNGETAPLKADLVILATGFAGEKMLKGIFVSPTFQDFILGSSKEAIPVQGSGSSPNS